MLIPLSSCQQLLSAKICHLDCLCYTAVKIKRPCINNMIISRSMLIWLIWSQMTLLHRRGSSEPCVEKTLHSTSTYQNSHSKRAFRFTAHHCPALLKAVNSGIMAAELRYQACPLLSCQALHGWRVRKAHFMKTCTTASWHLHGRIRNLLKVKDTYLN